MEDFERRLAAVEHRLRDIDNKADNGQSEAVRVGEWLRLLERFVTMLAQELEHEAKVLPAGTMRRLYDRLVPEDVDLDLPESKALRLKLRRYEAMCYPPVPD